MPLRCNVIFEGPNGSGKSTLAREFARVVGQDVVSTGGPKLSRAELAKACERHTTLDAPAVFDRIPMISQPVYDDALDRRKFMPQIELDNYLHRMSRPIVVLCVPSSAPEVGDSPNRDAAHTADAKARWANIAEEYRRTLNRLSAEGRVRLLTYDRDRDSAVLWAWSLATNRSVACAG